MKLRKQMGYKKQGGYNNDQFINDSKYIMMRVYNTEKRFAEELGIADKFISWDSFRDKMSSSFVDWERELRKFTMWLMCREYPGCQFELTEDTLNSDGSLKEIGFYFPNLTDRTEVESIVNNIWSISTTTPLTGLYKLYTDKNSPIKVA